MFDVKVKVGEYEVVAAGEIHAVDLPIDFVVNGLNLRFVFETGREGSESRYESEQVGDVFVIKMFNFNNELGEGVLEPLVFATFGSRDIAITFYVHSVTNGSKTARRFTYTLLAGSAKND